jgi:2-isopropylmalate synthase
VIISLHPHNDRGTASPPPNSASWPAPTASKAASSATANAPATSISSPLALNMYTQGVDPGLDFSDINAVARTFEHCTQLPIHPRHPYVGDLVFTAFSGSHQDAIKKGFAAQEAMSGGQVPISRSTRPTSAAATTR